MNMDSTIIPHIIGTVTLLILFSITGVYYSLSYSSLQSEIMVSNLQEVADYVSSEIVDLVSLGSLSAEGQLLIKELQLPEKIGGHVYNLTITESGDTLKVQVYLRSDPSVFGESILPWLIGGYIQPFNGTGASINSTRITPQTTISSISKNPVVWCMRNSGKITFGFGVMEA